MYTEDPAYAETCGNRGCPDIPRKPDLPRKCDACGQGAQGVPAGAGVREGMVRVRLLVHEQRVSARRG
jgi:hypothetical protein